MTKFDLFRIIIRIIAVYYLIISLFTGIPQAISLLLSYMEFDFAGIAFTLGIILLVIFIFYMLMMRTDKIVKLLKLDKGYDDNFVELGKPSIELVFKSAIVIIGIILIVKNLAPFLTQVANIIRLEFNEELNPVINIKHFQNNLIINTINVIVGLLLISNYSRLTRFFMKLDVKNDNQNEA